MGHDQCMNVLPNKTKKKMVLYMYFKFQYSIHVYFVEKGQCHNDYSVASQNGNVANTIAIGIHLLIKNLILEN